MQAVILAGGLGTRLGSLTQSQPKPMVEVCGVPFLEHQLKLLKRQSLTDALLCTGYLGEQIQHYFGDGSKLGMSIQYSREQHPVGTGGALRLAAPLIGPEFLLLYGDSYLPIDYHLLCGTLMSSRAMGVMAVYRDDAGETSVQPNISMDGSGLIRRYDKDSADTSDLKYIEAGVLALRHEVIDLIPPGKVASLEKDVYPALVQSGQLIGLPAGRRFYDIGTPERLRVMEDFFRDHN